MRATIVWVLSLKTVIVSAMLGAGVARAVEPSSASGSEHAPAVSVYRYALERAFEQVSDGELVEAYPALTGVIHSPVFDQLDAGRRRAALLVAGLVAIDLGNPDEGHALLVRSCALPQADGEDWFARLDAARRLDKKEDAILSLTTLARRWPEKLQELNFRVVLEVVNHSRHSRAAEPVLYDLLDGLYAAKWTLPNDIEPSSLWRDLAALELDRGRIAHAQQVVSRVRSPHVVVSMRIDRRFDPVREIAPRYFDVDAAVANELDTMRAIVRHVPQSLDAVVQLTYSMLNAGLYDDILQMTADVLRKIEDAPSEQTAYDDMEELIWILDNRGRALAATQRWSMAEAEIRAAANRKENGDRNISNIINLAWFYAEAGRNDEALAALLDLGQDMSPYGHMQMHGARYTAALQKGDTEIAGESFAYLEKHRDDALETWQWTLVRANRLDEAAALLIERLQDPVLRSEALDDVQDYANPEPASRRAVWNARWAQIKNRSDVRRAIDKVGRIESFRIPEAAG